MICKIYCYVCKMFSVGRERSSALRNVTTWISDLVPAVTPWGMVCVWGGSCHSWIIVDFRVFGAQVSRLSGWSWALENRWDCFCCTTLPAAKPFLLEFPIPLLDWWVRSWAWWFFEISIYRLMNTESWMAQVFMTTIAIIEPSQVMVFPMNCGATSSWLLPWGSLTLSGSRRH